ncbi:MAG: zonular occludens toxin domain-containing protein [Methylobacter sp.]|nr:zonular occludens toxin domain-containing protein [Methylobacter sp.]MDP2427251.1 zonular occludens toxin domain-containing protein [Methylobacter sp.]MDP3054446.1 zonular occludens toxin domain-containing protein [Methylobacter sp.]MDP3361430.1 zonular occludens toxin domain-containing protein [Methylobacter sp.]MDZ4220138.1 zonular occludens toxin domain-containing protein [Methylobacter sp.]
MATSIHHGPPGSFKSFTLVQRFAVDALEKGRVVVTNIRGFTSIDRVQDQFPDIKFPDSADLIFVSTEIEAGRQLMAGWFHWAPLRALILIDEGQRIYPDRRDFKLESLDKKIVPPGFDVEVIAIEIQDEYTGERHIIHRPEDVFTAFDMQRHFQWDVHLSTPNIAKIKSPIREVAECAYRHKSLGGKLPLFFKNTWYEFQHDAENAGKFANQIVGKPRKYKADEKIFACYQSTATGEHTESNADQSIFGDPKLKLLLFVIVCCIGVFIYLLLGRSSTPSNLKAVQPVESPVLQKTDSVRLVQNTVSSATHDLDNAHDRQINYFFDRLGYKIIQVAYQDVSDVKHQKLAFLIDSQDGLSSVKFTDLARLGIRVSVSKLCWLKLVFPDNVTLNLSCASNVVKKCNVMVNTPYFISQRDCSKYGDIEKDTNQQHVNLAQARREE